jgi:hypothetical protein
MIDVVFVVVATCLIEAILIEKAIFRVVEGAVG